MTFPVSGKTQQQGLLAVLSNGISAGEETAKSSITKAADAYRGDALWNSALFLSMGKILLEGSLMLPSWSELKDVVMYVKYFPCFLHGHLQFYFCLLQGFYSFIITELSPNNLHWFVLVHSLLLLFL